MPVVTKDLHHVSEVCFVRSVRRTSNIVTRVYNGYLKPVGLEAAQFWILAAIDMNKTRSMTELADYLGIEGSTLNRNIDRMTDAGLVVSTRGTGRRIVHRLTALGADRLEAALPLWREAQDEMEGSLAPARIERIKRDLAALSDVAKVLVAAAN